MNETKDFYVTMEWATKYTTFLLLFVLVEVISEIYIKKIDQFEN